MRKAHTFLKAGLSVFVLLVSVAACGDSDIGESCDHEGRVDGDCVDGAVCGRSRSLTDGDLVCLKQCTTPADCGQGEDCGNVGSTSLRGCRARNP